MKQKLRWCAAYWIACLWIAHSALLYHPEPTSQEWHCPKMALLSHIKHKSRKWTTDMSAGQSNSGNFLIGIPSSQMYLVVSSWQKKNNQHTFIFTTTWKNIILAKWKVPDMKRRNIVCSYLHLESKGKIWLNTWGQCRTIVSMGGVSESWCKAHSCTYTGPILLEI